MEQPVNGRRAHFAAPRDPDRPVIEFKPHNTEPQMFTWLWPEYLPRSELTILAGQPGAGKSTIAFGLAAILSRGLPWPSGEIAPIGKTLIWSGEDSVERGIIPRLMAAGANRDNIFGISSITDAGEKRSFEPSTDIPALRAAFAVTKFDLMILDSVVSVLGGNRNAHSTNVTRSALQPLVDMAHENGVAVLGIMHLTKNSGDRTPLDQVNGSVAYAAMSRSTLLCYENERELNKGVLTRAKSNYGPKGGGFNYEIEKCAAGHDYPDIETIRVNFGAAVVGSAAEIRDSLLKHSSDKLDSATEFLTSILASGPKRASYVEKMAEESGITQSTLKRARENIAETRKDGYGGWTWRLRTQEGEKKST